MLTASSNLSRMKSIQYWLMKSEISEYSWEQLCKDKRTMWDGIRNYQARNYLRMMNKSDLGFFYHSNVGKEIVGIVKIVANAYPDPTTDNPAWVVVDIVPLQKLPRPVSLQEIKSEPRLAKMQLVTNSRLSVQTVTAREWKIILEMSK